jgi:hypothetical protein
VRDVRLFGPSFRVVTVALCAAAVALALALPVGAEISRESADGASPLLVGASVRHKEVGTFDVLREGDAFLIPLEPFAKMASCTVEAAEGGTRLTTPLGPVDLEPSDVREVAGVVYLRESTIEHKLATPVAFDSSRFALDFDPPWRTAAGPSPSAFQETPLPDATPPDLSLSTLQSDIRYTRGRDREKYGSSTVLGGRMLDGYWRLRYQDDFEGSSQVRDYSWFHARNHLLFLAGHQNIRLHPLLQNVELTGIQVAGTNQEPDRFRRASQPGRLLARGFEPVTTFRGPGPPGGAAELRVNDSVVERQVIGLDGVYDFQDVSLPVRQASRIEVRVYDRRNPDVPVAIYEEERNASEFLLEDGALVHTAAVGQVGNSLYDHRVDDPGYAGLLQTRYGASDRLTLEAAVQATDDVTQVQGGIVTRLGRPFVLAVGLASSDGVGGYRVDLDGQYPRWRLGARSQVTEAGFAVYDRERRYDHMLQVGYRRPGRWDVALIGESWANDSDEVDYLLPAFAVRPTPSLALRARPDHFGDYRFDLDYRAGPRTRMALSSIDDRGYFDLTHRLGGRYHLAFESDFGSDLPDRQAVILSWRGVSEWRPGWLAGVSSTDGEPGYQLGGFVIVWPGVAAQMHYESDTALQQAYTAYDRRLQFNLTADLGFTQGRVHAARALSIRDDRGGVAGVVRLEAPRGFPRPSLAGLTILVDGRTATRTVSDGSYFIGGLRPGVFQVEIDTRFLPIEKKRRGGGDRPCRRDAGRLRGEAGVRDRGKGGRRQAGSPARRSPGSLRRQRDESPDDGHGQVRALPDGRPAHRPLHPPAVRRRVRRGPGLPARAGNRDPGRLPVRSGSGTAVRGGRPAAADGGLAAS